LKYPFILQGPTLFYLLALHACSGFQPGKQRETAENADNRSLARARFASYAQANTSGKRIFINIDDDNKNSIVDHKDAQPDYDNSGTSDNDFALITLNADGLKNLGPGHELWLGSRNELNLWGGTDKTPVAGIKVNGLTETETWYMWSILANANKIPEIKVYVEGTELGSFNVWWRLRAPAAPGELLGPFIAQDKVLISVEKMVWPSQTQDQTPGEVKWYDKAPEEWDCVLAAKTWIMNMTLIDFIKSRRDEGPTEMEQGSFTTPMPDYDADNNGSKESAQKWDANTDFDSFSTKTYADGFELEFKYSFDKSRGDGTFGYVQVVDANGQNKGKKLSFVGNSGIKFGKQSYEAAIIDIKSYDAMAAMAGGITVANFVDSDADKNLDEDDVSVTGYSVKEPLNKLMTGVEYGGGYDRMADTGSAKPPDVPNAAFFFAAFGNNKARANGHMKLVVKREDANSFKMQIYLDGGKTHSYEEVIATGIEKFQFQSHWGSGVLFSNMKVRKLP